MSIQTAKTAAIVSGVFILCIAACTWLVYLSNSDNVSVIRTMSTALKITSAAFHNGGSIPEVYTCKGKNISPPLSITGVPDSAKSLTLIMEDPDAPMGTWDHWIVFNINPKTAAIGEDEEPAGIHGKGSGDNLTYVGPCPPSGIHRYYFKVYALDIMLSLSEGATKDEVYKVMAGHILADGELVGKYGK